MRKVLQLEGQKHAALSVGLLNLGLTFTPKDKIFRPRSEHGGHQSGYIYKTLRRKGECVTFLASPVRVTDVTEEAVGKVTSQHLRHRIHSRAGESRRG